MPLHPLLLLLCAAATCVADTNETCRRELVWAPTPGKTSEALEVVWLDNLPPILVLPNATAIHHVHLVGKKPETRAGGCATQPKIDAAARIRLDPDTNNTLVEPLPGKFCCRCPSFFLFFPDEQPSFFSSLFFPFLSLLWSGRDVVVANESTSVAVLERLANMTRELARAEDHVFGPGAAPAVTSAPPPSVTSGHPGTLGADEQGGHIEALPGKKVLVAGVDVILELHRIAERIKNLKAALAACPCLAKPATCHPVGRREKI